MKTMYYQTSNFIRHTDNIVDLDAYRSKLEQVQRDSLARQPETACPQEEPPFQPLVLTMSRPERRRARRERQAWALDAYASLAVILMTAVFALRMLL